jgi:nitrite reductase (NADH) small subunit/3-phenylpropionate/trans-cinnamate dioxygenase ferredoxin subunit
MRPSTPAVAAAGTIHHPGSAGYRQILPDSQKERPDVLVTVCKVGDIPDGAAAVVTVGKKDVAVFHVGGKYYAIDDCCPHAGASLSGGHVENEIVTCPWHAWRFRLTDGAWADNPRVKTGCYPVRVTGDTIQVEVPDPA